MQLAQLLPPVISDQGNTALRVTGAGLENAVAVRYTDAKNNQHYFSQFERINGNALQVVLPRLLDPGEHKITVVGKDSTQAESTFLVSAHDAKTPMITSVEPAVMSYPSDTPLNVYRTTQLTVRGTNLGDVDQVYADGVKCKFRKVSNTHLEVTLRGQDPSCHISPTKQFAPRAIVTTTTAAPLAALNIGIGQRAAIHAFGLVLLAGSRGSAEFQGHLANEVQEPVPEQVAGTYIVAAPREPAAPHRHRCHK